MRAKPMMPRMTPSSRPVGSSRTAMRHQSRSRISPSAIARMMSDVACEPELPPELMTSGMNIARSAARSISLWNPCIAVAVSISDRKSAHNHGARFRIIWKKPMSMYGASSGRVPPNFWASSVCSRTIASMTSSTVTMPSTWSPSSMTGTASRLYFAITRATSSRSVRGVTVIVARRSLTSRILAEGSATINCRSDATPTRRSSWSRMYAT